MFDFPLNGEASDPIFRRENSELNAYSPLFVRVLTAKIVETKVTPEDGIFP